MRPRFCALTRSLVVAGFALLFGMMWSGAAVAQFGKANRARSAPPAQSSKPASAAAPTPPDAPGRHAIRISAAGWDWECLVHVPRSYRPGQAMPLVLILHGSGGDGKRYLDHAGWAAQAEVGGFLAVAPDGLPARPGFKADLLRNPRIWNSGQHDADKERSQVDDLAFFGALLDTVAAHWSVDPDRVYVTGHSNGGAMAFRLAAQMTDRFAAAAPVAAHFWIPNPRPSRPIPTLFLVGDADPLVPIQGGLSPLPWNPTRKVPPLKQTLDAWAYANGLDAASRQVITMSDSSVWMYGPDPSGVLFKAVFIKNQGHGWPGGTGVLIERTLGPNGGKVRATEVIWTFLKQYRRPSRNPAR